MARTDRTRTKLTRPRDRKVIAGVCAGIAETYGWGVGKVRLAFVLAGLFGAGELAYVILWILMPKR